MRYRPAIDLLRLLSAISIVCFHTPGSPYPQYTIAGLDFFVLLTFCLQGMSEWAGRPYPYRDRARRLLVPWLCCSLMYLLVGLASHHSDLPTLLEVRQDPGVLLIGTKIHLWFLPFAFFGGILAFLLLRATHRLTETGALIALLLLAAILAVPQIVDPALGPPLGQWAYSLPLLPIGLAIGLAQRRSRARLAGHYVAILAFTCALAWARGQASYLVGVAALSVAILPRSRDLPGLRWFAGLTMGIYLLHPLIFLLVYKYLPGSPWSVMAVLGTLGSAVLSGLITWIPWLGGLMFGTIQRSVPSPRPAPHADLTAVRGFPRPSHLNGSP